MDLQIDEDLGFQRKLWTAERVGWMVVLALVVAALLGAFGSGPLSSVERSAPDGTLDVVFPRFARYGAPLSLDVTVRPPAGAAEVVLAVDRAYLEDFRVDQVTPEPQEVRAEGDGLLYVFAVEGVDALDVAFDPTADHTGSAGGELGLDGAQTVDLHHFLYP